MTDNIVPFQRNTAEDQRRRVHLQRVAEALHRSGSPELSITYEPIQFGPTGWGPSNLSLVVRSPLVTGEVRIIAVTLANYVISTRSESGSSEPAGLQAALDTLRQHVRNLGISAIMANQVHFDPFPFPGSGVPAFEAMIMQPGKSQAAPGQLPHDLLPIDSLTTTDPEQVVRFVLDWHRFPQVVFPAGPRDRKALDGLRAVARARCEVLAAMDRNQIEARRKAGRLGDAWHLAAVEVAFDPTLPRTPDVRLTAAAEADLQADLAALLPHHLLWHFPRDHRGKLALGETILLAPYASATSLSKVREVWLMAIGPARRRDAQIITLTLAPVVAENYSHNWQAARWLWDARAQQAARRECWGVEDLPLAELGLDAWKKAQLEELANLDATAPLTERAQAAILLQDAGRLAEALRLFDIALDAEVERLVAGQPTDYCHRGYAEAWARATQEHLRAAALWQFEPLVRQATEKRKRWVEEKPRRRWSPPTLRLFWLPHQTHQQKATVVLRPRSRDDSRPRLEIDWSASNARLPLIAWRRPMEMDLLRFGLLSEAESL